MCSLLITLTDFFTDIWIGVIWNFEKSDNISRDYIEWLLLYYKSFKFYRMITCLFTRIRDSQLNPLPPNCDRSTRKFGQCFPTHFPRNQKVSSILYLFATIRTITND